MNCAHIFDVLKGIEDHCTKLLRNLESIEKLIAKIDETNQILREIKDIIKFVHGEEERVS